MACHNCIKIQGLMDTMLRLLTVKLVDSRNTVHLRSNKCLHVFRHFRHPVYNRNLWFVANQLPCPSQISAPGKEIVPLTIDVDNFERLGSANLVDEFSEFD